MLPTVRQIMKGRNALVEYAITSLSLKPVKMPIAPAKKHMKMKWIVAVVNHPAAKKIIATNTEDTNHVQIKIRVRSVRFQR